MRERTLLSVDQSGCVHSQSARHIRERGPGCAAWTGQCILRCGGEPPLPDYRAIYAGSSRGILQRHQSHELCGIDHSVGGGPLSYAAELQFELVVFWESAIGVRSADYAAGAEGLLLKKEAWGGRSCRLPVGESERLRRWADGKTVRPTVTSSLSPSTPGHPLLIWGPSRTTLRRGIGGLCPPGRPILSPKSRLLRPSHGPRHDDRTSLGRILRLSICRRSCRLPCRRCRPASDEGTDGHGR